MNALILMMSLGTGVLAQAAPTWPASAGPSPYAVPAAPVGGVPTYAAPAADPGTGAYPEPPPRPPRRFVVGFLPSIVFGVSAIPSAGPGLFLGGKLPRGRWALGYQLALTPGLADRYFAGIGAHRHHVTAIRVFGEKGRGFASVGGGAAFLITVPVVEVEGRVGVRLGDSRRTILAAQARLGWNVGHREQAPMPQLGLMFGILVW